jgi:hypothetical protein
MTTAVGAFGDMARAYRAHGLAPFPCGGDDGKHSLVRWRRFSRPPSSRTVGAWCARHRGANVGILTGASGLTVVDMDAAELAEAIERRCGPTPLVTATPRGGRHLWYRSTGQRTTQRLDGLPVDVRAAGGFVVAPPSPRPGVGDYRIVRGCLVDLARLPAVRLGALPLASAQRIAAAADGPETVLQDGERNVAFWRRLMVEARSCETVGELEARALILNEANCNRPLDHAEVLKCARSVWRYQIEGRNRFGGRRECTWIGPKSECW